MSESPNILYSIYGYIGISIFSSLIRYDFNVFFSYLILFLYSLFYPDNKKGIGKLIIHILCGVILGDIIWMIFILSYYNSSQNTNQWKYTSGLRSLMNFIVFFNLIIKGVIGYFLFNEFQKENGNVNDLINISDYFNDKSIHETNKKITPFISKDLNKDKFDKASDNQLNNNINDEMNNNYN